MVSTIYQLSIVILGNGLFALYPHYPRNNRSDGYVQKLKFVAKSGALQEPEPIRF